MFGIREFVSELEGKSVKIADTNLIGLQRLCEEFDFSAFVAKLSDFRSSKGMSEAEDADARGRIAALEEKTKQQDRVLRRMPFLNKNRGQSCFSTDQ
jgi:hypothetical protein